MPTVDADANAEPANIRFASTSLGGGFEWTRNRIDFFVWYIVGEFSDDFQNEYYRINVVYLYFQCSRKIRATIPLEGRT